MLNHAHGKPVASVVPVGQALVALREAVHAGQVRPLKSQEELFTDPLGHPAMPVQVLAAYAHFAAIYRRSPVGLPLPKSWYKSRTRERRRMSTVSCKNWLGRQ